MEPEEIIILAIGFLLVTKKALDSLNPPPPSIDLLHLSWKVYIIAVIIVLPFILYLNYHINRAIHNKIEKRKSERENQERLEEEISGILKTDEERLDIKEAEALIEDIKKYSSEIRMIEPLAYYENPLDDKLKEIKEKLKFLRKEEEVWELRNERNEIKREIAELERQKQERIREEEQDKRNILQKLKVAENTVFKKEELTQKEINVLLENGYEWTNEYCVYEKKILQVLVKPLSNHSKTHAFLVWSVKKLLENTEGVSWIKEHLSRDADIVFYHGGKRHAVEIELGSLLGKAEQTREKLKYLNSKYKNRWMFVVSNKNLLADYRKLGFATPRTEVEENLQKLLQTDTRPFRVESRS